MTGETPTGRIEVELGAVALPNTLFALLFLPADDVLGFSRVDIMIKFRKTNKGYKNGRENDYLIKRTTKGKQINFFSLEIL